jgi:hypothetical protein
MAIIDVQNIQPNTQASQIDVSALLRGQTNDTKNESTDRSSTRTNESNTRVSISDDAFFIAKQETQKQNFRIEGNRSENKQQESSIIAQQTTQRPELSTRETNSRTESENSDTEEKNTTNQNQLSEEEEEVVAELKSRDREVRAHEQAHLSAAGGLAQGGPSFTFSTGPDGQRYAIGGEVNIDTSAVAGDPAATLQKAQQIIAAANAPAQPSGQDRSVASQAASLAAEARSELASAGDALAKESQQAVTSENQDNPPALNREIRTQNNTNTPNFDITDTINQLNQQSSAANTYQNIFSGSESSRAEAVISAFA